MPDWSKIGSLMDFSAVPFLDQPVFDNFPETLPWGSGRYLRQGVHTKEREAAKNSLDISF